VSLPEASGIGIGLRPKSMAITWAWPRSPFERPLKIEYTSPTSCPRALAHADTLTPRSRKSFRIRVRSAGWISNKSCN
jgi:hypothetical protein